MARAKVRLNSRGMKSLLVDTGVSRDLERRAERVADAARSSAPVDTGEYRDSITVASAISRGPRGPRTVARVVARDRKSHVIESRTGNLARALDSAGGA